MPTCPVCGRENRERYSYCEHCGSKIKAGEWEEDQSRQERSQDRGRREDRRRREGSDRSRSGRQSQKDSRERERNRRGQQRQGGSKQATERGEKSGSGEKSSRSGPPQDNSGVDRRRTSQNGIGRRKLLAGGAGLIAAAGAGGVFLLGGNGNSSGPKAVVREYVRYGADGEEGIDDSLIHSKSPVGGTWEGLGEDVDVNPKIDWQMPEMAHVRTDTGVEGRVNYYLVGKEDGEWKIVGDTPGVGDQLVPEKPAVSVTSEYPGEMRQVTAESELGKGYIICRPEVEEDTEYNRPNTGEVDKKGQQTRCQATDQLKFVYGNFKVVLREDVKSG